MVESGKYFKEEVQSSMQNNVRLESRDRQTLRVMLKAVTCLLLLLGFSAVATATPALMPSEGDATVAMTRQMPSPLRTRTPTVARSRSPTATPILSPQRAPQSLSAPRLLPGQPNVDEHTVALYHFDSLNGNSALDATGHYTGTLNGNAWITSVGQYSGALQVDGSGSYVRAGHLGDLSSGTLEAFIDFSTACDATADDFTIIAAGGEFGTHQKVLSLRVQTGLAFGIFANGKWNWADSGINPCRYLAGGYPPAGPLWPYEAWRFHHVAGTW